jgi:hypothetical protein
LKNQQEVELIKWDRIPAWLARLPTTAHEHQ